MYLPFLFLLITTTYGLPDGAPQSSCQTMMPFHGGGILAETSTSPFSVSTRTQGDNHIVTLDSPVGLDFKGFIVQGRTPTGHTLGNFVEVGEFAHTMDCNGAGDSATHKNTNAKRVLEFKWLPPSKYEGPVIFNATIAQEYNKFWVGIQSEPIEVKAGVKEQFMEFDPFYTECNTKKLCFGTPNDCISQNNCKAVVAVTVYGSQYDFEMKATGNAAWVGVGLSDDEIMGDDSVIECVKTGNTVSAYLSWTSPRPNLGVERLRNQLGIRLLNGSVIDGNLHCVVRRDAQTNVNGKIFDLIKDQYNLLIAAGSKLKPTGVGFHDISYLASGTKRSLSDVSEVQGASKLLIRLHGSFMLAAWIGTVSIGTLMARYYRQTWVGSSICGKDIWFAWHRFFMIITWCLTMAAFALIFIELKRWSEEYNPHAILGTITTILCFFQPIGAFFRPHPGASKRQLFNWLHWLSGNVAHIIAIVTLFFAVKLTKAELPDFVDYILAAYVAVHVVVHLVLSVIGCISEKATDGRISAFPMKDLGTGRNSTFIDRNSDAPYSGCRKFLLGIYILFVVAITIALIVITALAPIENTWKTLKSSMTS